MSDEKPEGGAAAPVTPEDADNDEVAGYKAPAEKSIKEILNTDQEDESLQRYKAALIGDAAAAGDGLVVFPDNPNRVIVQKLALVVEGRPDKEIDLSKDLAEIKKTVSCIFFFKYQKTKNAIYNQFMVDLNSNTMLKDIGSRTIQNVLLTQKFYGSILF